MVSSRKEALASNQVRYFTGKSCKAGHIAERYAKTGTCVICMAEHTNKWHHENKERRNTYQRIRRAKPERKRIDRALNKAWFNNHPGYNTNAGAMARYRKYGHNPKMPWQTLDELVQFYYDTPEGWTVDHIIPIKHDLVCGLHVVANLQYLTKEDNDKKGNDFVVE